MAGLAGWSATRTAAALRRKEVSAREVLDASLEQIARTNPRVNALVTLVDPDALLRQATEADERLARGEPVGPLHGLPLAVKDTEPTAGLRTTSGSPLFADHVPDEDSLLVQRERAAGAIVVGKSNVPEFAAGSHTFNAVFGVTRNPYDLSRSAGGSSGGAAAALACAMVALADGSDLGGSLRNPASFCGVVGLRPSIGRVPSLPGVSGREGPSLGVHGPLGRTVEDVALLLSAQAGPDRRVGWSLPEPGTTYRQSLAGDLTGLRVAWCPGFGLPFDPEVRAVVDRSLAVFAGLGAVVVEAEPDLTGADEAFQTLRARQFADELGTLFHERAEAMKETVRWNVDRGLRLTAAEEERAARLVVALRGRVASFMEDYDVLVLPTVQVLPFPVETEYPLEVCGEAMGTYVDWMRSCSWISVTGQPAISVPAGFTPGGLPVGMQIVGRAGADLHLLTVAYGFQQASDGSWRPPGLSV